MGDAFKESTSAHCPHAVAHADVGRRQRILATTARRSRSRTRSCVGGEAASSKTVNATPAKRQQVLTLLSKLVLYDIESVPCDIDGNNDLGSLHGRGVDTGMRSTPSGCSKCRCRSKAR
jgi:hypothetical protein